MCPLKDLVDVDSIGRRFLSLPAHSTNRHIENITIQINILAPSFTSTRVDLHVFFSAQEIRRRQPPLLRIPFLEWEEVGRRGANRRSETLLRRADGLDQTNTFPKDRVGIVRDALHMAREVAGERMEERGDFAARILRWRAGELRQQSASAENRSLEFVVDLGNPRYFLSLE
jgi:hypothetical protein